MKWNLVHENRAEAESLEANPEIALWLWAPFPNLQQYKEGGS